MIKQLSGLDTLFRYIETAHSRMEVSTLQIYDSSTASGGKPGFEEILAIFESRLYRSRTFRRKLLEVPFSLDFPYWTEDPDFDIRHHVHCLSLPSTRKLEPANGGGGATPVSTAGPQQAAVGSLDNRRTGSRRGPGK